MSTILQRFYSNEGNERVGFILNTGEVVEVENISEKPQESFIISSESLIKYEDTMVASFHTHPNGTSNLSSDDYIAFRGWPDLKHFIIGKDGISCYIVNGSGTVLKDETQNCLSRLFSEASASAGDGRGSDGS